MLEKWAMILLIGIALFGIGFTKGCSYASKEHDLYVAKMEADSEKLLNTVLQRNAAKLKQYDADAKLKDVDHAKEIAKIRAARIAATGVKLFDPGSQGCGSPGSPGKDDTGKPESGTASRELSEFVPVPILGSFLDSLLSTLSGKPQEPTKRTPTP